MTSLVNYSLIACCTIYLVVAIGYLLANKPEWAIVYFAYCVANVGLIWAAYKGT